MRSEVPDGWEIKPVQSMISESRIAGGNGLTAKKLTVKLHGKGVVAKEDRSPGSEGTTYFRRKDGQFIYSKLDFLNGAFAIIPGGLSGRESTSDLPAFDFLPGTHSAWFLYYVSRPDFYTRHGGGAIGSRKARRVSPKEFGRVRLLTPPLPEQKKIAAILSSVDEAIQATQTVIEQTRRVKEGLLQDLLTRGIGHKRFKQTEVGEIPEGWRVLSVGQALSIENNKRKPISRDIRSKMPGPYPYWGPTRIQDHINEYAFEGDYALVGEDGDHFLKWQHSEMTVWATGRFNVNNHAHALGSTVRCRARWFFYFFMHRDLRHVLTRQGAGRYKLTKAGLEGLHIAVPPIPEQDAIIEMMNACRKPLGNGDAVLESLQETKAGLLQDLLTGKVRVSV